MHPLTRMTVPAGRLAVHWFGQSSFAVRSPGGAVVYIDPYFPHERPRDRFVHAEPPVDEVELPAAAVLLTHDHLDHTHPQTLARIAESSPEAVFVCPAESAAQMKGLKVDEARIVQVAAGGQHEVGDVSAQFVYAKPPEGDPSAGIGPPDVTHLGIVISAGGARVYFSGDPINNFAQHEALTGAVKALAPRTGFLTCHPTEGEFPFFDGSVKTAVRVGLRVAYPSHYDCFTQRTYDPAAWAKQFEGTGVEVRIVGYNEAVLVA